MDSDTIIENDPIVVKGWRIGQILTSELFDLKSERGPEIDSLVDERRKLLDKKSLDKSDEKRLIKLDEEINKLPVFDDENQKLLDSKCLS